MSIVKRRRVTRTKTRGNKTRGNKTRGNKTRGNQRGGIGRPNGNIFDEVIYPYLHDATLNGSRKLELYNYQFITDAIRSKTVDTLRTIVCSDRSIGRELISDGVLHIHMQKWMNFVQYLRDRVINIKQQEFDTAMAILRSPLSSPSPPELPNGWISNGTPLGPSYINIYANKSTTIKPSIAASESQWQSGAQVSAAQVRPSSGSAAQVSAAQVSAAQVSAAQVSAAQSSAVVRPTLTSDRTEITTGDSVTITPSYGEFATLMVTIFDADDGSDTTIIANSDINDTAQDVMGGLNKTIHGDNPFTYTGLKPGAYSLRLIGEYPGGNSISSEPLIITVKPLRQRTLTAREQFAQMAHANTATTKDVFGGKTRKRRRVTNVRRCSKKRA